MKKHLYLAGLLALGALAGSLTLAQGAAPPPAGHSTSVPLAPDAPSIYTVQRGDTLWAIASKFLTQPWYWPEIWYLNPEIKNPHRIYPGDTLRLVYDSSGRPQVRLERGELGQRSERGELVKMQPQVRSEPLDQAIPAIPYEIVAAFMSKPSVIAKEDLDRLPYLVAIGDGQRNIAGMGDVIYVRGITGAEPGERFNTVHVGEPLKDPDSGKLLGYQGIYTGLARLERPATGEGKNALAKLLLTSSARETLAGDRLIRDRLEVPLDFVPHAPPRPVAGRIMSVVDGVSVIGSYQVVVINRGTQDGLESGHVLIIWQQGGVVPDRGPGGLTASNQFKEPFVPNVRLPTERIGTFMVFRAYDHLSYGLIMTASSNVHVGDSVKSP